MTTLPNAAFSIALDCQLDNVPGTLGRLCAAIGEAGGNIGALDGFDVRGPVLRRSLVVHCRNEEHQHAIRLRKYCRKSCVYLFKCCLNCN